MQDLYCRLSAALYVSDACHCVEHWLTVTSVNAQRGVFMCQVSHDCDKMSCIRLTSPVVRPPTYSRQATRLAICTRAGQLQLNLPDAVGLDVRGRPIMDGLAAGCRLLGGLTAILSARPYEDSASLTHLLLLLLLLLLLKYHPQRQRSLAPDGCSFMGKRN